MNILTDRPTDRETLRTLHLCANHDHNYDITQGSDMNIDNQQPTRF